MKSKLSFAVMIAALNCCYSVSAGATAYKNVTPTPELVAEKLNRHKLALEGFPDGISDLPFFAQLSESTDGQKYHQAWLKSRAVNEKHFVPFDFTGHWTEAAGLNRHIHDKRKAIDFSYQPMVEMARSYFSEGSTFKRRKIVSGVDKLTQDIQQFEFPSALKNKRYIHKLRVTAHYPFNFDTMTKTLVVKGLDCGRHTGYPSFATSYDSITNRVFAHSWDGYDYKFYNVFFPIGSDISDRFKAATNRAGKPQNLSSTCNVTYSFDSEDIAEKVDVAAAEGKLTAWSVLETDLKPETGIPSGKMTRLILAEQTAENSFVFLTEIKSTSEATYPTITQFREAYFLEKFDRDKAKKRFDANPAVYKQAHQRFINNVTKGFFDVSASRQQSNKMSNSAYIAANPSKNEIQVIFRGATQSNQEFFSLVNYHLEDKGHFLEATVKEVVTGGLRDIPDMITITMPYPSEGYDYFNVDWFCGTDTCAGRSASIKTNQGYAVSQFNEWVEQASKPQKLY